MKAMMGISFTPDMQRAIIMMDSPFGASETEKNGVLIETLDSIAQQVNIAIPSSKFSPYRRASYCCRQCNTDKER